jgi:HTH-type transcriptional regulator/antitoxin HigA
MANLKDLRPFKVFGPGVFIREQMELREWNQADLAEVLSMTPKHINALLNNKLRLTTEMAQRLGGAFGQSPNYWLAIDAGYQLFKSKKQTVANVAQKKSYIYEYVPVLEMIRLGWLIKISEVDALEKQLCDFFRKVKLDFSVMDKEPLPCFRKSDAHSKFSAYAAQCWYQMAKNISEKIDVPQFNRKKLENLLECISAYTSETARLATFLFDLNAVGVKFFVLKHLQKTYLDGAAFLYGKNPVIVYTSRYDRLDNFWFTLAHEIAHVLMHISTEKDCFFDDITKDGTDKKEMEANDKARGVLQQNEILHYFSGSGNYIRNDFVITCSKELKIHPSIIAGTLSFHKKTPYSRIHLNSPKVVPLIPDKFKPTFLS